jgi:hypothetical protein
MNVSAALLIAVLGAENLAAQTARPVLADASPYVTQMNGGRQVDCTAEKVKVHFGSGRGEGYCQAVLADLVKAWENGVDATKLDTLIPSDKMPAAPPAAYELKGDKLGSSMAEYLQHHSDDCVAKFAATPGTHHSAFSGNKLENTDHQHINAFRFVCQNIDPSLSISELAAEARLAPGLINKQITLATAEMNRQQVEFSQQRLYLIAYYFNHDSFGLVQAAFVLKFGAPAITSQIVAKNLLGAQLTRTTSTWKNGISTIELSEMSGDDLTKSQVVLILDDVYSAVEKQHASESIKSVKKDM